MKRYNGIKSPFALTMAIQCELKDNGIECGPFAILAEGNALGEYDINVLDYDYLKELSPDEMEDLVGYGYKVCLHKWGEVYKYAEDCLWAVDNIR